MKRVSREKLIAALDKAVDSGEITEKEARAELRAYESEMQNYEDWCDLF